MELVIKVDASLLSKAIEQTLSKAFADVVQERQLQDEEWGGPEHDDTHDIADWMAFIQTQDDKLFQGLGEGQMPDPREARERLVKIAALAIAGIESIDRKSAL